METIQAFADRVLGGGDPLWLIPAIVGTLIVLVGLIRLLIAKSISWTLVAVIAFGGTLTGLSMIKKVQANADGVIIETAEATRALGSDLKDAVAANSSAIEEVKSAVGRIQDLIDTVSWSSALPADPNLPLDAQSQQLEAIKLELDERLIAADQALERSKTAEEQVVEGVMKLEQIIRLQPGSGELPR